MNLFLLWLGISIVLLFISMSLLTVGSRFDDIMLGDNQYKTKEELDKEMERR